MKITQANHPLQFQRRKILGDQMPIAYDPLRSDPDYLVLLQGQQSIYGMVGVMDNFRLLQTVGDQGFAYEVYERIR